MAREPLPIGGMRDAKACRRVDELRLAKPSSGETVFLLHGRDEIEGAEIELRAIDGDYLTGVLTISKDGVEIRLDPANLLDLLNRHFPVR